MNREKAQKIAPVMQAYADGADVLVSAYGAWSDRPDRGNHSACSFRRTLFLKRLT